MHKIARKAWHAPGNIARRRAGPAYRSASGVSNLPRAPKLAAYALIGLGAAGLSMGLYTYYTLPASPYPPEVTQHIRKALYYEGAGNDPKQAVHCYLQALEEATKLDLDQTGDDMTGLKIKIGAVYEHSGRADSAIRVYIGLLGELQASLQNSRLPEETKTRLLRRAIGTSVKIGDLSLQVDQYRGKSERYYTWALETFIQETAKRQGDSSWMDLESIGGLYEAVAAYYYADNRPELALPLYLKALDSLPSTTCHTVTILNNIASSISSQSNAEQVQINAAQWGIKARDLAHSLETAEDGMECKIGCVSALYNLGMIAEKRRRIDDAKEHYTSAIQRALKLRDPDAREIQEMSTKALQRL